MSQSKLRGGVESLLAKIPIDFGGGCSVRKAYLLAWLINRFKLSTSLDIGVYRGRSLLPQALSHRESGGGLAYGVDPWSAEDAEEHDHDALRNEIEAFVASTNFEQVYQDVMRRITDFDLAPYTIVLRTTSDRAARQFAADGTHFGLIHIDGNHDAEPVLRDVRAYFPLLQPGGFLVMDDVSWPSVKPAVEEVLKQAKLLLWRVSPDGSDDYAVFRKPGGRYAIGLKARLRLVAA